MNWTVISKYSLVAFSAVVSVAVPVLVISRLGLNEDSDQFFFISAIAGSYAAVTNTFLKAKYYSKLIDRIGGGYSLSIDSLALIALLNASLFVFGSVSSQDLFLEIYIYCSFFCFYSYSLTYSMATDHVRSFEISDIIGQLISVFILLLFPITSVSEILLAVSSRYLPNIFRQFGVCYRQGLDHTGYVSTPLYATRTIFSSILHKNNGVVDRMLLASIDTGAITIYSIWEIAANLYVRICNRTKILNVINDSLQTAEIDGRKIFRLGGLAILIWLCGVNLFSPVAYYVVSSNQINDLIVISMYSSGFILSQLLVAIYLQFLYKFKIDKGVNFLIALLYLIFWAIKYSLSDYGYIGLAALNSCLGLFTIAIVIYIYNISIKEFRN